MNDTPYDIVHYKNHPLPQTHPDRLAALATLFGMKPHAIRKCRILELACGNGNNLIPMAYGLPQSELIGIDMARGPISKGQDMINTMGLKNIILKSMDIMDVGNDMGLFDYIIAHGVFSWVPPEVQEQILSVCKNNLAPHGVAYVSYNTYPGWHLRGMVREIMRFHADHFPEPDQKVSQARSILKLISEGARVAGKSYGQILTDEMEHVLRSDALFHDELSDINRPLYFHEFMVRAQGKGLKYLAEADFFEMQDHYFAPQVREALGNIGKDDIIVKEQFMDFMKGRKFRQTLLRHDDVPLNRKLHPDCMRDFYFSCPSKPVDRNGELLKGQRQELMTRDDLAFHRHGGSTLGASHPVTRAALLHLSGIWPERLQFKELLGVAKDHVCHVSGNMGNASEQEKLTDDFSVLADTLLTAYSANIVELHIYAPHFVQEPGDRPVASALSRIQAQTDSLVTNLCHRTIGMEETYGRILLPLLDGTRDINAIHEEMVETIRLEKIPLNGKYPSEKTLEALTGEIDSELMNCARYALLEA
ncbi:MAG: methyltransferase regulatory domain-containing protein [Deltaproteobacteria bacterium]|nr:methyltransferase regulatory domain-containing protein [Deltaproteobacteria bacterium]